MGKSTINGPFSIAMLNYQRVIYFRFSGCLPKKLAVNRGITLEELHTAVKASDLLELDEEAGANEKTFGQRSHGIDGPFIDGLPIKNGDFPWLC